MCYFYFHGPSYCFELIGACSLNIIQNDMFSVSGKFCSFKSGRGESSPSFPSLATCLKNVAFSAAIEMNYENK